MPERIESSLLVVAPFKDDTGLQYQPGDQALLRHRSVRRAALERPDLFAMEYAIEPVDLAWLTDLDKRYEAEYAQLKQVRDEEESRKQVALREELRTQDRKQPKLERRYEQQQAEGKKLEEEAQEERERRTLEAQLAVRDLPSGFHYEDD